MKKLVILLGVVGVSFSAILVRSAQAPALVLVFSRMLFAAAMLLPVVLLRHRQELKEMRIGEYLLSALSGVFLGLHFALYFSSLRYTTIAASVALVDTEVFFVAILSGLLWKKRIPPLGWLGIGITFLGSLLIAGGDVSGDGKALLGDLLAVLGAAAMSVYTIIGTRIRKTRSTTVYTALVYAIGALTVGIMLIFTDTPAVGYGAADYLAALGMSIFCTLLGHSVFSWGLKYESPAFVSTVKLMEPVFASILGVILFREIPGAAAVTGGILVIFGVAWYAKFEN